jgi:hypothetical protein
MGTAGAGGKVGAGGDEVGTVGAGGNVVAGNGVGIGDADSGTAGGRAGGSGLGGV